MSPDTRRAAASLESAASGPASRQHPLDRFPQEDTPRLTDWEQYRALVDATTEAYGQIDATNREARFAIWLTGGLGAAALFLLTHAAGLAASAAQRNGLLGLCSGFAVLALVLVFLGVEALRPGRFRPKLWDWTLGEDTRPAGVRYYEDIVRKSAAEHWQEWRGLRLAQLNAELSVQLHSLSKKNYAKHEAIRRLYLGLRVLALALGMIVVTFTALIWGR